MNKPNQLMKPNLDLVPRIWGNPVVLAFCEVPYYVYLIQHLYVPVVSSSVFHVKFLKDSSLCFRMSWYFLQCLTLQTL